MSVGKGGRNAFDPDHFVLSCDECGCLIRQSLNFDGMIKAFDSQRDLCRNHSDRLQCPSCQYIYNETLFPDTTFQCPLCGKLNLARVELFVKAVEDTLLIPYAGDEWQLPSWREVWKKSVPAYLRLLERHMDIFGIHFHISMTRVMGAMKQKPWEEKWRQAVLVGALNVGQEYAWKWSAGHNTCVAVSHTRLKADYKRKPRAAFWGPLRDQPELTDLDVEKHRVAAEQMVQENRQLLVNHLNQNNPRQQARPQPYPATLRNETVAQRVARLRRDMERANTGLVADPINPVVQAFPDLIANRNAEALPADTGLEPLDWGAMVQRITNQDHTDTDEDPRAVTENEGGEEEGDGEEI